MLTEDNNHLWSDPTTVLHIHHPHLASPEQGARRTDGDKILIEEFRKISQAEELYLLYGTGDNNILVSGGGNNTDYHS